MLRSLGCFSVAESFHHFSRRARARFWDIWEVRVTWDNLVEVPPGYSKLLRYPKVIQICQLLRYPNEVIARYSDIPTRLSQVTRISQNTQISQEPRSEERRVGKESRRAALVHEPLLKTCSDRSVVSLWPSRSTIFHAEHVLDFGISGKSE